MSEENLCEERVFNGFYLRYSRDLYNWMYYRTGDQQQAADHMQEAFLKIFENCGKIELNKAKSYLFTTASNLFLNVVKHRKVRINFAQNHSPESTTTEDPEFVLREKEYMRELQEAIADLTPAQREVFLMNRIDGKKYREIAGILGISEKAVEKRMIGALKKLRAQLEDFQ